MKNFPLLLAWRYIRGKKSSSAINIITGIATIGLGIEAAALIIILSVFNGFESIIAGMYNQFNPDLMITPEVGKTFAWDDEQIYRIKQLDGIKAVSGTLEEIAMFENDENQSFGRIKGVDTNFVRVNRFDNAVFEGEYNFSPSGEAMAVVGNVLGNKLSINLNSVFSPLKVYMVKTGGAGLMGSQAFIQRPLRPTGIFAVQQDIDREYVLTNLRFVQELLQKRGEISALEIGLQKDADVNKVKMRLNEILPEGYEIKDRYEQDASFLKLMNIEKWVSFSILCMALILVAFNLVGALWLIVLDKKRDIAILKSMGLEQKAVSKVIIYIGALLGAMGTFIGSCLAMVVYFVHQKVGIVKLEGAIVDKYPSELRPTDFLIVTLVVVSISVLASLPAARRTKYISPNTKQE